jgi:hypothetical protein
MSDTINIFFRIVSVFAIALVAGCYSAPIVKADLALAPDDKNTGFLLVGADRKWTEPRKEDPPLLQLLYRKSNESTLEMGTITFLKDADLVLHQLPAGEYNIYNSFFGYKHMGLPKMTFRILPGQITYVGDFNITVVYPKIGLLTNRTFAVSDNRESAVAKLKTQFPVIAKTYLVQSEITPFKHSD